MATYNGERFVRRQLESILPQLGPADEVIVSDDGSTDQTLMIVESLRDARIRILHNSGRHGPVGNFENALRQAKGDHIFLSDQDDVWLPNKVMLIRPLLDQYDLVLTDCEVADDQNKTLMPSFFAHRGSRAGLLRNLYKNSYVGCCMAFRRSLLKKALPFPSQIYMHDWWLGLVAEAKGQVYFLPEPTIRYIRHGGNASPTGEGSLSWFNKLKNRLGLVTALGRRLLA
ncbi:glycosyltransferase family 2 protein [Tellurirhabdus bombi]|uniref:glycosyltransferase family 2 protein n=1 Tax=Tellurirhabdus bombi TaxID=2907205 RepID=UPI001F1598D3|nr:glycosyltransferase family 2 protein [Tellurirhabdus bombi]